MRSRPGATTSGLATPCAVGPRDDHDGTLSSERSVFCPSLNAPAVTITGSSPGFITVPADGPLLPAATTTTIPCRHSLSTA